MKGHQHRAATGGTMGTDSGGSGGGIRRFP